MSAETRIREAIRDSLKQLRDQHAAALESLVESVIQAAVADSEAEVADARAHVQASADQMLEKAQAEADEALSATLKQTRAEADEALAAAVKRMQSEADETLADALRQTRAEADERLAGALKEARAEAEERLADALKEARAEADKARAASIADARVSEREADLAGVARLLEAIRALDKASSITEVLDTLGTHAAEEADRVAVLLVRGDRLRGWSLKGFGGAAPEARSLDLGLDGASVIVEAVRSKRPKTAGPELSGFGFAPLPTGRAALAVPIEVGGLVVAVLYADDATSQPPLVPSAWPEVVEILGRHAGRCLEALTVRRTGAAQPALSSTPT